MNQPARAASAGIAFASEAPPGFAGLAAPREALVDIYFGGRKVGEALALTGPGRLRLRSPDEVLARLPDLIGTPEVRAALSADLPTNGQAVCSVSNSGDCGVIAPQVLGIIYDEDHFRVDIFVNPRFLRVSGGGDGGYLPLPEGPASITSSFGAAASGTVGGSSAYNLQNRTIIGLRNARVRANMSIASNLGFVVDDLVAEVDRRSERYSAGLFWAPGNEFTGQRRIAGLGVGTQFDTWLREDELHGTPLIIFLNQSARVELLVDGRLVSSRSYAAGNIAIDTSALPDGAYPVLLRIHDSSGSVHEERRFFVKNAQIAPSGHPIFYAYGGLLANTRRNHPVSLSRTFYYQAGAALRLANDLALDASILGTQHKAILEAGGWLIEGRTQLRAAGLVSSAGDSGALLEVASGGHGPLSASLDVRRIWSSNGRALIPLPAHVDSFGLMPPTGVQLANGSYTQATGSLSLSLGRAYLSLVGSFRKDRHLKADYSIGPSVNWPLVTRNRVQLAFEASAQRTRSSTAAFAGLKMLFSAKRVSMIGTAGQGYEEDRGDGGRKIARSVGSLSAQYSYEDSERTSFNAEAGVDRDTTSSTVHAGGTVDGRLGDLRADLLHNLEGRGGTQYNIAYQSAVALNARTAAFGGRDLEQSALVVAVTGDAPDASFDVLVDEVPRGEVKPGQRLSLFVPGYRTYKVRLVARAALPVSYDSASRDVTLYPGNVRSLVWAAQSYFTVFGQAVSPDGVRIADALVQTPRGVGETDSDGYFQVDARENDSIIVQRGDASRCRIDLAKLAVKGDFASVGKVICR